MSYDTEQDYQNQKVDLSLWKRLFGYALRNKKQLVQNIIALIIVAVIDTLYPIMTRYAIDHHVNPGGEPTLDGIWLFALGYVALILVQTYGTMTFIKRSGDIEMAISYDIRQEAFLHLQNLSFSFYDNQKVGHLLSRVTNDLFEITELLHHGPEPVDVP